MFRYSLSIAILFLVFQLGACTPTTGIGPSTTIPTSSAQPTIAATATTAPANTTAPTQAATTAPTTASSPTALGTTPATAGLKDYKNAKFGVCLQHPSDWFGPEVEEFATGFTFEIGTDKVYPSSTPPEQRVRIKPDSYYMKLIVADKPANMSVESYKAENPWLQDYLDRLQLKDGETKTTARTKITRVRSVKSGDYSGAEFIVTLSESAQTEIFYTREVFLANANLDTIRISGQPENVTVTDKAKWQEAYKKVDEAHQDVFRKVVDSISQCAASTPNPYANSKNVFASLLGTTSAPQGWSVRPCEGEAPLICFSDGKKIVGAAEFSMFPIETLDDFKTMLSAAGVASNTTDFSSPERQRQLISALDAFVKNYHSVFETDRAVEYGNRITYQRLETRPARVGSMDGLHYGFAGINKDGSIFERWLSYVAFDGDLLYLIVAHYRLDSISTFDTDQQLQQVAPHLEAIVANLQLPFPVLPTEVKSVKALRDVEIFRAVGGQSNPVGQMRAGETAPVTGTSSNKQWWRVNCPNGVGVNCWISADPKLTQSVSP